MGATSSSSTPRRPAFRRRRMPPAVAPRLTPILYHTTQKQTRRNALPAADGFRIASPCILPIGELIRWNSPPRQSSPGAGRRSITYNIMCFITSQSLMVSSLTVGSQR